MGWVRVVRQSLEWTQSFRIAIEFIYVHLSIFDWIFMSHTHTHSALQWKSINLIDWVAKCSVACMQHMRTCRRNNVCNWTPNVGALNVIWSQSPSVPLISHIFLSKINVLHSSVLCTWKHTHTHTRSNQKPTYLLFVSIQSSPNDWVYAIRLRDRQQ